MGQRSINDLGETMLTQLNEIVNGGDDTVKAQPNSFVSWCQPGIPFEESDFDFAVKGLGGGADAEEDKLLLQQAFNFSQVVDFIPDASGLYKDDQQQAIFRTSEARLSHMYHEILNLSRVVDTPLTEKEKEKIEKFRNLLWVKKEEKNIVTDEKKVVTAAGPIQEAYDNALDKYIDASMSYGMARIQAEGATGVDGKAAVANFSVNGDLLRLKVKRAEQEWESRGHRSDVDAINAYIAQVTGKSMLLWKQRLIDNYNDSLRDSLNQGGQFFYSTVIPGNFAHAKGWTNYSVYHSEQSSTTTKERTSWKAGGKMNFGLFSIGGDGGSSKSTQTGEFSVSDFRMEFEMAQVLVSRPGMYPEFFMNRGWDLDAGHGWHFDGLPSDGEDPPKGLFVAYPTTILFVRNVKITSKEFSSEYKKFAKEISGSAGVGWGPFSLKGSASSSEETNHFESTTDGSELTVSGMQIIGFKNHIINKAPNLAEGIDKENLV
ncbi:MAG: hypothetical protein L3J51_12980 [Cocleimonas sp.]|nr:hypothetical protein [Cocleimonas sp.]